MTEFILGTDANAGSNVAYTQGVKFTALKNCLIVGYSAPTGDLSSRCMIQDMGKNILASTTMTSAVAVFSPPYELSAGQSVYILCDSSGASRVTKYSTFATGLGNHPVAAGSFGTFQGGYYDYNPDLTLGRSVKSVSFEEITNVTKTSGTAEIATRSPVTSGLTAGTTKQAGRIVNLVATRGSLVSSNDKIGIDY